MRVQLDNGRQEVDLEDKYLTFHSDFLSVVERALTAMGYRVKITEIEDDESS